MTDEAIIRQWLGQAARQAGLGAAAPEFADRVLGRLAKGAREYGDANYLHIALEALVDEAAEEGDDIGGWTVLAGIRLLGLQELEAEVSQAVQGHLLRAAGYGLAARRELESARELIV